MQLLKWPVWLFSAVVHAEITLDMVYEELNDLKLEVNNLELEVKNLKVMRYKLYQTNHCRDSNYCSTKKYNNRKS